MLLNSTIRGVMSVIAKSAAKRPAASGHSAPVKGFNPLSLARFDCTHAALATLPQTGLPEVAFVGRSNAGKSSAINVLANQKQLAFASKTPGRTQHFNYFAVPQTGKADAPLSGYLVDLPGYGFAQVGQGVKTRWAQMFTHYLVHRQPLAGVVALMDIRHPLTDLDAQLLELLLPAGRPVLVLLTKADKVNRQEQTKAVNAVKQAIVEAAGGTPLASVLPFSSTARLNLAQVRAQVCGWLNVQLVGETD
jgi:GTP-binding protein